MRQPPQPSPVQVPKHWHKRVVACSATKYKGDKSAEAKLIQKVKAGGSGSWGDMPMPPNSPQVKDEDIKTLVEWVLSL